MEFNELYLQALCSVEDQQNLLGSRERITKWKADVEQALSPHFSDAHQEIRAYGKHIEELRANGAGLEAHPETMNGEIRQLV